MSILSKSRRWWIIAICVAAGLLVAGLGALLFLVGLVMPEQRAAFERSVPIITRQLTEADVDRMVRVEGLPENSKSGCALRGAQNSWWIDLGDGKHVWPEAVNGKRVRVMGLVVERSDLPVFVRVEGQPEQQGMPMPEGTVLDQARRRYVLERAHWQLLND